MNDKILHEIKIIETDEGFRLEINGDKEHLQKMGYPERLMRFGRRRGHRRHGRQHKGDHGRHRHHGSRRHFGGYGPPPWGWWESIEEEGGREQTAGKSPKAMS